MVCGIPSGLLRGAVPLPVVSGVPRCQCTLLPFWLVQEGEVSLPSCGVVYEEDTLVLCYFYPFSVIHCVPCVGLDSLAVHDGGFPFLNVVVAVILYR